MTNRIFPLLSLLLLASCAVQDDMLMQKSAAPALPAEAVMVEVAQPAADTTAGHDSPFEECTGDGIGGTGCPDL